VQHALATALAEVGRALGLGIIGFQVEGTRALGDLRRMGVDYAQGYAIGRPEPLAKALATLG
jgi:EAL domain-containing protein (putative c-di-GMP-specific phosphodiesterase class I)